MAERAETGQAQVKPREERTEDVENSRDQSRTVQPII
jgi:hypothetical protein